MSNETSELVEATIIKLRVEDIKSAYVYEGVSDLRSCEDKDGNPVEPTPNDDVKVKWLEAINKHPFNSLVFYKDYSREEKGEWMPIAAMDILEYSFKTLPNSTRSSLTISGEFKQALTFLDEANGTNGEEVRPVLTLNYMVEKEDGTRVRERVDLDLVQSIFFKEKVTLENMKATAKHYTEF